ncbi:peptidylprolyl isomerase [Candidatus Pacearchaeota archaeon]|nr:peptidylprolyl isomerase [Candidatus Pacearchaeota archaeon]
MATPLTAQDKSKVSLHYEGRLDDGTVFDSSTHGDHSHPLEFVVGAGNVIPGFEKAVIGMKVDETKTFSIPPAEAYGDTKGELTHTIPKSQLPPHPEGKELGVGMQLGMKTPDGHTIPVAITAVDKDSITLDMNHPLAGKTLTFTITVVKIE